ncbi:uracil-DNA glycosylase [Coprobacter secundus]|uniref:Uracil-DNA glycosylase n=1 Tax=Coprobacter secundus subsp. similis TaxID=2751153 RepID=A0A7G1HZV2_9BACT|nr:uracil-DNA glycosylase [Coprobacter secundus]KHM47797.1 uracil-DNA glycosylase [Coprobacter secundus]BCI63027.1 uracil-DNA glycosylase 2 [Coprobacter secundus subsp. similis]CCY37701.1 uracil-DNA glycosylase 1 [Tannerella sp. CAG:118]
MDVRIEDSWKRRLQPEFNKPYFEKLVAFVKQEYARYTVYPPGHLLFYAFDTCPFDKVKVVIIGQDPYHEPGQYYGLCFSVLDGVPFPPSLVNIFKEVQNDLGKPVPRSGRLERWSNQGVLLINSILTVRAHQAGSHQGKGWEEFTDAVIKRINDEKENVVFMLWGAYAQKKGAFIDRTRHCVLTAPHPSPLSADRGFFGCKHFSKANEYFRSKGLPEIDW